ncbi:PREDICTED: LOW QUALITY PROTEIN: cyclic nucleotide-gated cation channel alpha-3-like [Priapulus caudatus]|uniref:LOW QUALITY PROTEIN: cyclic nucleotide-gated cation channel alpha-3-like n=1 Tax=Priapulus caudatus TaxID=37621 RepID=A0ABM1DNG3_PRICU|nr:PREDICTED: LOW QUALITY PROTEIN: cyclic nucleotide-gated cation channel alpha-3-like [Priapulus caudatus]
MDGGVECVEVLVVDEKNGQQKYGAVSKESDSPTFRGHPAPPDTPNGPKSDKNSSGAAGQDDRTKLIGERLSSAGSVAKTGTPSPVFTRMTSTRLDGARPKPLPRRQKSIVDILTRKLSMTERRPQRYSKEEVSYVNKAHFQSVSEISPQKRQQRRKEIREKFEKWETSTSSSERHWCSRWTFVFDPSGRLAYYWSSIMSMAFLYNFWILVYRFAFDEITHDTLIVWFSLDYLADLIYIIDVGVGFRTGYLEDGVLSTDPVKLRKHYMNCTRFYIDCLCLVPLDFLYLSIGFCSILRGFRLVKIYRFWGFLDRTERHTNYPNVVRTLNLIHTLLAIFHWNACFYFIITAKIGSDYDSWSYRREPENKLRNYLHSFYWSTRALTMIGDLPQPRTKAQYVFCVLEIIFGLFLFATVLGHVSNIVTNVSAARKEFQARLDDVKTYMSLRRVPRHLQDRVIRWFDYLWITKKSSDEEKTLHYLPDKLKAEIAIHVHLDTLKQVGIFRTREAGFLCELVLRLRPVLFSPGDHICRKGEVGKEMYIVNRGRVQVVANDGKSVLATLKAGSYFGEISILNMGTAGNRRTASVKSVGYSDLFRLSKGDLWDVLKEYPAARVRLEAVAARRMEGYRKSIAVNARRSSSTPGLVETSGRQTLESPTRRPTLPSTPILPYRVSETSDDDDRKAQRYRRREESLTASHNVAEVSETGDAV